MLMLSACASMHGLKASAAVRAPDSLASSQSLSQAPASADGWPIEDWWTALGDPQLDELIREGL